MGEANKKYLRKKKGEQKNHRSQIMKKVVLLEAEEKEGNTV